MNQDLFHGKLLLFGEHSILAGSHALVIPYRLFSGSLMLRCEHPEDAGYSESNRSLKLLADYLEHHADHIAEFLDIGRFRNDLEQGLYFRSDLPGGYGLGSSGAVCAAVYSAYGMHRRNRDLPADVSELVQVRNELAGMESCFHGHSSGTDPLCIYYDRSFRVDGSANVLPWDAENMKNTSISLFLMDTGRPANTGEGIRSFKMKMATADRKGRYHEQYIPLVNRVVEHFARGAPLMDELLELSAVQSDWFGDLIPEGFRSLWHSGTESGSYACKLCGSGGGGFIIGFTEDLEKAARIIQGKLRTKVISVEV